MSRESENYSVVIFRCTHCNRGIHPSDEHVLRGDFYHGDCLDEIPDTEPEPESDSMGPLPPLPLDIGDLLAVVIVLGILALFFLL